MAFAVANVYGVTRRMKDEGGDRNRRPNGRNRNKV